MYSLVTQILGLKSEINKIVLKDIVGKEPMIVEQFIIPHTVSVSGVS